MPHLIIRNVWAVGMYHYRSRHLAVGERYELQADVGNRYDSNAIKITDGYRTCGYLKSDNAVINANLIRIGLKGMWLLKPKELPEVKSYKPGPQQRCNIGCICESDKTFESGKGIFKKMGSSLTLLTTEFIYNHCVSDFNV